MLRLYGSARSRALRNIWMLNELGLDYEHTNWMPRSPETKTQEFRALNSGGAVPVLDDNGFILSESMAINFYLAKKHGSDLYPSDLQREALALQWCLWETDKLDRAIVNHGRHSADLPETERDPAIAQAAWQDCVQSFQVLNIALEKSDWLVGPTFTVADLNVASAMFRALVLDLSQWPKTKDWFNRCWDRPAAQKAKAMRS
ncbi:MAG: glutathione S-transferase family protein [Hyphomicrobiaceae bacterium]